MARQMQRLPMPKPRPTEQVVLATAAANLRAVADAMGALTPGDPRTPEGALSELVAETLALVDRMLAGDPEMRAPETHRELPSGAEPTEDQPSNQPRNQPRSQPTNEEDDAPTKVSF
jgi:hypothetical protein